VSVVVSGFITPCLVANYALRQQRQQQLEGRRSELRETIDFAAKEAGAAFRRLEDLEQAWREGDDPANKDSLVKIKASNELRQGTRWAYQRLRIRLGNNDPTDVIASYETWLVALGEYSGVIQGFEDGEEFQAHEPETVSAKADLKCALDQFLDAGFERVGSHPQACSPLWPSLPLPEE
jgi:hypothetical protein